MKKHKLLLIVAACAVRLIGYMYMPKYCDITFQGLKLVKVPMKLVIKSESDKKGYYRDGENVGDFFRKTITDITIELTDQSHDEFLREKEIYRTGKGQVATTGKQEYTEKETRQFEIYYAYCDAGPSLYHAKVYSKTSGKCWFIRFSNFSSAQISTIFGFIQEE
ncbi:MAG: hypothetical protein IIY33_00025 [Erysipelotrichaceae bacterium]|nr:hypothetical protein [Erysipelotrichaceae bacterium]MBQ1521832.1 hypothetical protein [Erysipelotrichaceae bacterium]